MYVRFPLISPTVLYRDPSHGIESGHNFPWGLERNCWKFGRVHARTHVCVCIEQKILCVGRIIVLDLLDLVNQQPIMSQYLLTDYIVLHQFLLDSLDWKVLFVGT